MSILIAFAVWLLILAAAWSAYTASQPPRPHDVEATPRPGDGCTYRCVRCWHGGLTPPELPCRGVLGRVL